MELQQKIRHFFSIFKFDLIFIIFVNNKNIKLWVLFPNSCNSFQRFQIVAQHNLYYNISFYNVFVDINHVLIFLPFPINFLVVNDHLDPLDTSDFYFSYPFLYTVCVHSLHLYKEPAHHILRLIHLPMTKKVALL